VNHIGTVFRNWVLVCATFVKCPGYVTVH